MWTSDHSPQLHAPLFSSNDGLLHLLISLMKDKKQKTLLTMPNAFKE